jgi:transcription-repair coupling factor (superfamily II helicase)
MYNPGILSDKKSMNSLSSPHEGAALSVELGQLAAQRRTPVILVTRDTLSSDKLLQELQFFTPKDIPLFQFPDWETLPYDNFSVHQEIISERLRVLSLLPDLTQGILITTVHTLMQRVSPRTFILAHTFYLKTGDKADLGQLKKRFIDAGYQAVSQVIAPGEFAVRGSLFDIFPMGSNTPYRIDLFDNEIEAIRLFDPDTQRTKEKIEKIELLPAREFPFHPEAIQLFKQQWRDYFGGNPIDCPVYETLSQGSLIPGIEYYFPLFFENTASLFEYLPKDSLFIKLDGIYPASEKYWREIKDRHEQLRHDRLRPILSPEKLFLNTVEVFTAMKLFASQETVFQPWSAPDIRIDPQSPEPVSKLTQFLQTCTSRILFCAESAGRREALLNLFHQHNISPFPVENWAHFLESKNPLAITAAPLDQGAYIPGLNIQIIPENALLGEQIGQNRRRKNKTTDVDAVIKNLAELNIGGPVVHIDHGVGRYQGLQTLALGDIIGEFLILEYTNQDKLYVPVSSLHLISRYSGLDPEHAPLHRLGTDQWEKAKRKAAEKIHDTAAELLEIHAKRELRQGFSYPVDTQYPLFASQFSFEETPDQQQAILNVIEDMQSAKSMDRLICGDVGFGKTEVAMRAAFIAVQSHYQTVVLVPTTLLAQQHEENFRDRFADWPVNIVSISRFKSPQEQKKILSDLQAGKIDIIIGTHKLLQPDIQFHRLGLVIIDEEHRFGVRQKERLKALRAEVDILTLTATPIPRTLNMAMSQMRDLSIISTPPQRRLSIKTFVHPYQTALIREAVLREILRGGQVYFLHNDVDTIRTTQEKLEALIPEARIAHAHGQMRERELEQIMRSFHHHRYNVLICTTIIETGIDIPSANTIIIERADKFGLAQLHQLRGRVGRSHHQAYAYLLTPPHHTITSQAQKRLDAISQLEDLGAGFLLATHDLEIRGAGELLGEEQSGNMQEIGFSLYMDLLDRAVKTLKKGEKLDLLKAEVSQEIDLQIPALIPEDYVPDVHTRLVLYKRIASAKNPHDLAELQVEFIDRFGLLPDAVKHLFDLTALKLKAEHLGILKIQANKKSTRIEFNEKPNIDSLKMIKLIQQEAAYYKLEGSNKMRITREQALPAEKFKHIEILFEKIKSS